MTIEKRKELQENPLHYDSHSAGFRDRLPGITEQFRRGCPMAWSDTYGGFWVTGSYEVVSTILRNPNLVSNDHDPRGERKGYQGITLPEMVPYLPLGFLEMDPPEQRDYRVALNPYLSPVAVERWKPMADDLARACVDEVIESGHIDFIDDLIHIVPAVLTTGMLGQPLGHWRYYAEPLGESSKQNSTGSAADSPYKEREETSMMDRIDEAIAGCRENPQPGWIDALIRSRICGEAPDDLAVAGTVFLLIAAGFDTTKGWIGNSLEWLSDHPVARAELRTNQAELLDAVGEEFLRYFTPTQGIARTIAQDCEIAGVDLNEGDRLWMSLTIANRDPAVFPDPDNIHLVKKFNRHSTFGLGIHRCIGSNLARMMYRAMVPQVLDRMPDYSCIAEGTVKYENIGVSNGIYHLPATFAPGPRRGPGLDETLEYWQKVVHEERLAEPVSRPSTSTPGQED